MKVTMCDKCKKNIEGEICDRAFSLLSPFSFMGVIGNIDFCNYVFCKKCTKKFRKWLNDEVE